MQAVPLDLIVSDALALGYEVSVFIWDDDEEQIWCANSGKYLSDHDPNQDHAWSKAMESVHGGPLLTETEISNEEVLYEEEMLKAFPTNIDPNHGYDLDHIAEVEAEMKLLEEDAEENDEEEPHNTWFDPRFPDAVVDADSACYCGWLGIDCPPKEYAPPGCSCFSEGDD